MARIRQRFSQTGAAAVKLNGVLVDLELVDGAEGARFEAPGLTVSVERLEEDADWRQGASLVFELEQGLSVGYRGFYECSDGLYPD